MTISDNVHYVTQKMKITTWSFVIKSTDDATRTPAAAQSYPAIVIPIICLVNEELRSKLMKDDAL